VIAPAAREVEITLYDEQQDFVDDPRPWLVFLAGRFAGKTYAGSIKAALHCLEPGLGLIAAPNFPMLEHAAKRQFLLRLDELGLVYEEHKSLGTLAVPSTGAEVVFATLETESRIRGPGFAWAWVDEIEYIPRRSTWLALKGAIREGDAPQLFATTTPKGRRLVWEEWVRDGDERHILYRASTYDNPFIDAGRFVRSLGYTGQFYAQEIEASFVAFEGLVYPAFNRETHVRVVDTSGWTAALGLDLGFNNPTALLVGRQSGERLHVEHELYQSGMSSNEVVAATAATYARTGAAFVVVDPSAANLIRDLQLRGLHVRKAINDRIVGIQRVSGIIDGLTVDPACVNLIAELESYHYPERQTERDVPVKEFDHAADALRYLVMELYGPRRQVRFF
jgi:Terminase large subunit, T4likevirus-type, N-terminal